MKCLPATKVSDAKGRTLHDSHAEILAIRCLNHFLIQECKRQQSLYVARQDSNQPFGITPGTRFHMYCSEAPCGDSSMELTIRAQKDPTPWPVRHDALMGRGYFSELGIVRRKPARADSPETLSKSCSDKLALKQCTSLLSSVASTVIVPKDAYLSTLIVPQSQHVEEAFSRSFSSTGRLKPLAGREWSGGFAFKPFRIMTTGLEFRYSRRVVEDQAKGSNTSAIWNPYVQETLINGVLQGWKQTDPKAASSISRVLLARDTLALHQKLDEATRTYGHLKHLESSTDYQTVKQSVITSALMGWVPNIEDNFAIEI